MPIALAVTVFSLLVCAIAAFPAVAGSSEARPNKDGSFCGKKADSCTDEKGNYASEFLLNGDSDCVWRIDVDYGDGTTETGQYADTDAGYRLEHRFAARRTHAVVLRLSEGRSASGIPCGTYSESYRVQYPEAPKKNDAYRFQGSVQSTSKPTFVMSHPGPGYVQIAVSKATDWRDGLKGLDDLRSGIGVAARARFDGRRWRADWVERWKEEGEDARPTGAKRQR